MRIATQNDRSTVIDILTRSFLDNPTLLFLARSQKNREKYIARIAEYAFDFAIRREGVFISDNEKGVAICFRYNYMKRDFRDALMTAQLVVRAFSIRRILSIVYHNYMVNRTRPQKGNYLYFWFFGVEPDEQPRVSGRELWRGILNIANYQHLDVYAETTLRKNKIIYERFGFTVYHKWENPLNHITVWFMQRPSPYPHYSFDNE